MNLRLPAYPLITTDPYFSVWSFDDKLNASNTVHWTGKENRIIGTVEIDGKVYCFMGKDDKTIKAEQLSVDFTAFSTIYKFSCGNATVTAKFTSPLLIEDIELLSRPVSFLEVNVEGTDDAIVKITAFEQLCLNEAGQDEIEAQICDCRIPTAKMGSKSQPVLKSCGDDIRIDYGYFYLSTPDGRVEYNKCDGMNVLTATLHTKINSTGLFCFAYDDIYSIEYFGEKCLPYWKNNGTDILKIIEKSVLDYKHICRKCDKFSAKLYESAASCGGEKYAEILLGAYRQVMAAHKLVVDKNGEVLWVSKENSSNGCAATVDISYPSSPLFMLYNIELLKGMLRPVFRYSESDKWEYDFAPHDVGTYPLLNGQTYYECQREYQMPVEECGNMLVLSSAVAFLEKNVEFVKKHKVTLDTWAEYLVRCGFDPENQLCTDDFAGHLAHNCNLSLKAICALGAYSRVCSMMGDTQRAEKYSKTASNMAVQWTKAAANGEENYRLAFDKEGGYSLKYNLIWDSVFGLGLFDGIIAERETAFYIKKLKHFGFPLDNREDYTKADWLIWCASLAEDKCDFEKITETLWNVYNETKDRVPMTDWYMTSNADYKVFKARSVLGGLWIYLLKCNNLFDSNGGVEC